MRSLRRIAIRAILFGALAVIVAAVAAPVASAQPSPCTSFGYLFQSPVSGPSAGENFIQQVDLATGQQTRILDTTVGGEPAVINAVGYHEGDGFFYGMGVEESDGGDVFAITLYRVYADGHMDDLGRPAGIPVIPRNFVSGDVDPEGYYWVWHNAADTWWKIDLTDPSSPTYGDVADTGTATGVQFSDWVYINDGLYAIEASVGGSSRVIKFNPQTEQFSTVGRTTLPVDSGAGYTDSSGYYYASENLTGNIKRIDLTTLQTINVSTGQPSEGNDGARCASAPVPTITVTKTVAGRIVPADQFTVGLVEDTGRALTSATTTGAATTVSTTNWPVSEGRTYTITDAMAPG